MREEALRDRLVAAPGLPSHLVDGADLAIPAGELKPPADGGMVAS